MSAECRATTCLPLSRELLSWIKGTTDLKGIVLSLVGAAGVVGSDAGHEQP